MNIDKKIEKNIEKITELYGKIDVKSLTEHELEQVLSITEQLSVNIERVQEASELADRLEDVKNKANTQQNKYIINDTTEIEDLANKVSPIFSKNSLNTLPKLSPFEK